MHRLIAAALLIALTGCTGSSPRPAPTPSPGSSVSAAASELGQLAMAGTIGQYAATYVFRLAKPKSSALVKVWQAPPALRIDVISSLTTASLFITSTATYSCGRKPRKRQCFRVAGPRQPIPAPFNVGPASLFSTDLETLARYGRTYIVAQLPPTSGSQRVLGTNCFTVRPAPTTPSPQVQSGTYCFADNGVLTAVTYPSGNTAELAAYATTVPPATFTPYAKPQPLPA